MARGAPRKVIETINLPIVTRREALLSGAEEYFTGVSCVRGHIAPRLTKSCKCLACRREIDRAALEQRYAANPEEFLKYRRRLQAADPVGEVLRRAKARARRKQLPFSITRSDVVIAERCPCCGQIMGADIEIRGSGNSDPKSPSLDRIRPGLGYVPGNVAVICWRCNQTKGSATEEELRTVANWLAFLRRENLKLVVGG
jgi:hypothetical protein